MSEDYDDRWFIDSINSPHTKKDYYHSIIEWIDRNYTHYPFRGQFEIEILLCDKHKGDTPYIEFDYDLSDYEIEEFVEKIKQTHRIYKSYDEWYGVFRWYRYNLLDTSKMGYDKKSYSGNSSINYSQHTLMEQSLIHKLKHGIRVKPNIFDTSDFIEHMSNMINPFDYEFDEKMKERIVFYKGWNRLNDDDFFNYVSNYGIFLSSTKKLIGVEGIKSYIKDRFTYKEHLINQLLDNLVLDNEWNNNRLLPYSDMCFFHNDNFVWIDWLFGNNIKRSIRIFENEMRVDLGQKTIGSFYNEDVLFKSIQNEYGKKYKVISQGSPNWLKPQRLDVYLPELEIGIEYQGEQHYRPVDFGGKGKRFSKKQFKENQERDERKKQKCVENNCVLLEMRYNDKLPSFMKKLDKIIRSKVKN